MSDADDGSSSSATRALTPVGAYLPAKLEPVDHILSLLKATLGFVSPLGGALASLIGDYVPSAAQRANDKAFELLFRKVAKLQDSKIAMDTSTINKEEFAELYKRFQGVTANTNREEKLRAAANIVANALLPPGHPSKSTYTELDHLMHCVDALSTEAIAMLGMAIQTNPPRHASGGDVVLRFPEIRQRDQDPHLAFGLACELRALNLLHITEGPINVGVYENYQFRVTPMGVRFHNRFLKGEI
jgi:hypothetical protein